MPRLVGGWLLGFPDTLGWRRWAAGLAVEGVVSSNVCQTLGDTEGVRNVT
jgi:hypothetical protein